VRILITNDDGILSGGIYSLFKALSKKHEVYCIAPLKNKSGCSSSIHIDSRIYFKKFSDRFFGAACFPADCVTLGFMGLLDKEPEIIVSGINRGANYECDVQYSGTVGAARQAYHWSIPGIALSLCDNVGPYYFQEAAQFLNLHFDTFLDLCPADHFLNINMPNVQNITKYAVGTGTKSDYRVWANTQTEEFVMKDSLLTEEIETDTDRGIVDSGQVSVCILSSGSVEYDGKH